MGKESNKKYDPIVFMNTPISDDNDDVIGINSTVEAIKRATDSDAKMIGVIADYGSGKSSLTHTLATDKKRFGNAITINMWDYLSNDSFKKDSSQVAISLLTKSFLFQLASGISDNTAKHVNRRLSKNYGIISFSISSHCFWLWTALAAVAYIFFAIITGISFNTINDLIKTINPIITQDGLLWWTSLVKYSAPFFMVAGIAFAVIGLRNTSIAFSHWKAQNTREPEVNDVFEAYMYIYKKLLNRNQHRLVTIEDLDRIDRKSFVVGFLKEVYRFNSLPQKSANKNSPVFVISVKPESLLKDYDDDGKTLSTKLGDDEVFSKLFDYTVTLKPIHYADYGNIVLKIIGDEKSKARTSLQNILEENDKIRNDKLSASFSWIIEGHNLTIRQLKDRLNSAVALLVSLKNKGYTNQSYISFSSCASVAYLELQYPELYSELIKQEDSFSKLVQQSYSIRNNLNTESKNTEIRNAVDKFFEFAKLKSQPENQNIKSMKSDIVKMLLAGDISDDFRMYFYSFPRGSYIKNSDERDISRLLLLPNDCPADDKLDEKIGRIIEFGKEKTVTDILIQISNNTQQDSYAPIIVQNEFMFKSAYAINSQKVEVTVHALASWENSKRKSSQDILTQLFKYHFDSLKVFWASYASWLLNKMDEFDDESKTDIRRRIISVFGDEIVVFRDLFIGQTISTTTMPIISENELLAIPSIDISISLINTELISEKNIDYISSHINQSKLIAESYEKAHQIYSYAIKSIPVVALWKSVIVFLKVNEAVDLKFFSHAVSEISEETSDKEVISHYINSLPIDCISNDYCNILEAAIIDINLSDEILQLLYDSKIFTALLSSLVKVKRLDFVDFTAEENSKDIISACEKLVIYDVTLIPQIRKEIIRQYKAKDMLEEVPEVLFSIFYNEYPVISIEELGELDSVPAMLRLLNRRLVDLLNYTDIVKFINGKAQSDDCLTNFQLLFSNEYDDEYQDNSIAASIIDVLDITKIGFYELDGDGKKQALKYVAMRIDLANPEIANSFMIKANCLLPSLEKTVVDFGDTNMYIGTINQIDAPTDYTIEWLVSAEITYALSPNLLKKLLEQKQESKYLVGKVMAENAFEFPYLGVSSDIVISHYKTTSPIWDTIKDNICLVNHIIQNENYEKLNETEFPDVLRPLYLGKQTLVFVKFLFSKVSDSEKLHYLSQMGEIQDAENSIGISNYLSKEPNISLLKDDNLFNKVRERLWEDVPKHSGYKGVFTRKRKSRFQVVK